MKNFLSQFTVATTFMLALYSPPALAESKAVEGAKEDFQTFKGEVATSLDKIDKDLHVLKEKAKDMMLAVLNH